MTLRSGKDLEFKVKDAKKKNEPTSIQTGKEQGNRAGSLKLIHADPNVNATTIPQQTATEKTIVKPPQPFPQHF